jgi:hypothetical protein
MKRNWASLAEALGVFFSVMLYIWWVRLAHPWVLLTVLGFIGATHFIHGEGARRLGFGWRNFRGALAPVLPWVALAAVTLAALGHTFGTVRTVTLRQAATSILAYTVWGLFQQYLLNGYFVNRLAEFAGEKRRHAVALSAAALFSLAHLPNWFLMLVTLAGGYAAAQVYLRYRSLYVLALAHGILGFFLFLVVPDSIAAHFLVGPRYVLRVYGTYPELLL